MGSCFKKFQIIKYNIIDVKLMCYTENVHEFFILKNT